MKTPRLSGESSLASVDALIQEVQSAKAAVDEVLSPLLQEQARLDARLKLLKELRSTYAVSPADASQAAPGHAESHLSALGTGTAARIQAQVAEVLGDNDGGPLHSSDIHREFVRRGWPVPGAGRPNNITAHLTAAPGIISPQRGYWALGDPAADRRKTTARKSQKRK